ncbi:YqzL family protein [Lentibacillus halophilus]|uniref:YqzL family protein n=1 Tax=Lentibacillus halophilus TaxID=295065 RepID=A0ABP3J782_9BACI
MIDFTWKIFSQTGNIETYLLMKELEKHHSIANKADQQEKSKTSSDI